MAINLLHIGVVVFVAVIMLSPFRRLLSRPALRQARQTSRGTLLLGGLSLLAIGLASLILASVISEKWNLFIGLGVFGIAFIVRAWLLRRRPALRLENRGPKEGKRS